MNVELTTEERELIFRAIKTIKDKNKNFIIDMNDPKNHDKRKATNTIDWEVRNSEEKIKEIDSLMEKIKVGKFDN